MRMRTPRVGWLCGLGGRHALACAPQVIAFPFLDRIVCGAQSVLAASQRNSLGRHQAVLFEFTIYHGLVSSGATTPLELFSCDSLTLWCTHRALCLRSICLDYTHCIDQNLQNSICNILRLNEWYVNVVRDCAAVGSRWYRASERNGARR